MSIKEEAAKMKLASPLMASASAEKRNSALLHMIENLEAGKEKIFAANGIDLAAAKASRLPPAVMKRLAFDEGKLADSISGIRQLISLPDPVGKVTLARQLDEGLRLYRVTCPIGVIAMIFEAPRRHDPDFLPRGEKRKLRYPEGWKRDERNEPRPFFPPP